MSTVDNFKAKLSGGGARPSLFKVTCNFPAFAGGDSELASFMIKGAQIPGDTIGLITVNYRGRQVKLAGNRTFEDMTFTIINDENFKIRTAMEKWMNGINSHVGNTGSSVPTDYMTDMIIQQLNQNDEVIKTYYLRGAFPVSITPIDLSFDTVDAIEEFSVTLAYQYWDNDATS